VFLKLKIHQVYFCGPSSASDFAGEVYDAPQDFLIGWEKYSLPFSIPFDASALSLSLENFLRAPMSRLYTDAVICHRGKMQHLIKFDVGRVRGELTWRGLRSVFTHATPLRVKVRNRVKGWLSQYPLFACSSVSLRRPSQLPREFHHFCFYIGFNIDLIMQFLKSVFYTVSL